MSFRLFHHVRRRLRRTSSARTGQCRDTLMLFERSAHSVLSNNTSLRFSTSACPIGEFSCTRPLPPAASDETHLGSTVPLIVHIIPLILCGMIEKKALSAVTQLRQTLPTRLYVCLGRKRLIGDGRAGQVEFPAAGYNWGLFGTCSPFVRGQCLLMSWDEVLRAFKERLHHAAVHQI